MSIDTRNELQVSPFPELPPSFDRLTVAAGSLLGLANNEGQPRFPDFEAAIEPGAASFRLHHPRVHLSYDELTVRRDGLDITLVSTCQRPLYEADGSSGVHRRHLVYNLTASRPTVDVYGVKGTPGAGLWYQSSASAENPDDLHNERISDTQPTRALSEEDCRVLLRNIHIITGEPEPVFANETAATPDKPHGRVRSALGAVASRLWRPVGKTS
ncbi:MAG TPA: hypothetical protein VLI54_03410 [Bacillota bacterium]|nr:hypothetical protein [Bacillota bacterium]